MRNKFSLFLGIILAILSYVFLFVINQIIIGGVCVLMCIAAFLDYTIKEDEKDKEEFLKEQQKEKETKNL